MTFANALYTIILYPLIQIIEIAFFLFDKLFDNTGIATMGVSLTVTLLCLPLYIVAENWEETERRTQSEMKTRITRIKQTFKGDEQYMIMSHMYKLHHYHPIMALRSSFGLLIQIPFFMAAYSCLSNLPALKDQSFLFIRDMGAPDAIFTIGSFAVNILPIAMTAINCIAGAIYTKGHSTREKIQIYGMALLFLVILYDSPSGLVLYWTMNNIFSLVKNIFYKLKNPLKVLYFCTCAAAAALDIYILFIYDGAANIQKRLCAALPVLLLIPIPLYIKGTSFLLNKPLHAITQSAKSRFSLFAFSSIALCLLTGIVIPSSMITSSVQEFSNIDSFTNPNQFLIFSFWQSFGIFIFWSWCIYFLFKARTQTIFAFIFAFGLACSLINTYAFAGNYGSMDVTLKFIDGYQSQGILFTITNITALIIAGVILITAFVFKKQKIITSICMLSIFVFVALSVINCTKTTKDYNNFLKTSSADKSEQEIKPKLHLSKTEKNVVILMLDRCESAFLDTFFNDFPEKKSSFDGFTYYKNTVSFNGHTLMAAPALYGGYEYTPQGINARSEISLKDKNNEALLVMPKLFTEKAGYSAFISDLSWANYSYIPDMTFAQDIPDITSVSLVGRYTAEYKKEHATNSDIPLSQGLKRNFIWVSFFRQLPAVLRTPVYCKGSWLSSTSLEGNEKFIDCYSVLHYLPKLTDYNSNRSTFIMMANEATHFSGSTRSLNLVDKKRLTYNSNGYINLAASLIAVADWLDTLRQNGVYDNTRIIIVADHGIGASLAAKNYGDSVYLGDYEKDHLNPMLLVKDFGKNESIKTDMTFMTNADVPAIALDGIIDNPTNPWTGKAITTDAKADGVYVTSDSIFMPWHSKSKNIFTISDSTWYKIKDNIFEKENWIQEVPPKE